MSFTNLGLNEALLRAVEKAGYTTPTPIQQPVLGEHLRQVASEELVAA